MRGASTVWTPIVPAQLRQVAGGFLPRRASALDGGRGAARVGRRASGEGRSAPARAASDHCGASTWARPLPAATALPRGMKKWNAGLSLRIPHPRLWCRATMGRIHGSAPTFRRLGTRRSTPPPGTGVGAPTTNGTKARPHQPRRGWLWLAGRFKRPAMPADARVHDDVHDHDGRGMPHPYARPPTFVGAPTYHCRVERRPQPAHTDYASPRVVAGRTR